MNDFHMLPSGGHAGINRIYNIIKRYYFWPNLKENIKDFVQKCNDCQRHKHFNQHKEPLTITTTASSAFQTIFLDLVGPLSPDFLENRYILTIQCELSKFVEPYATPNKETRTVAKAFINNFVLRFGIPNKIVTVQGTEFLSNIFQESCKLLQIAQFNSTAHHHETIGALENTHKHLV